MAQKANLIITLKDKATKGIKRIGSALKGFAKSVLGSKLTLAALAAAIGLGIRAFAQFEKKLVDVGNLFQGTTEQIKELGDGILDLTTQLPVNAQNLAEALFDVVSAGVAVSDSLEFLAVSAKLAVAGVTGTKTAVNGLTSVINAYGFAASDAEKISDKFFAAQVAGKTTIEELSNGIGTVAPIAVQAGISIDELLGSISALTKQGIRTDQAVTQIRAAITSIIAPSKEATDTAKDLEFQFDATALKTKGLAGVLKDVQEATGGNIETMAKLFPNIRALNGALALSVDEFSDLDEIVKAVAKSLGLVDKAAENQINTLGGQFTILLNNIKKAFFDAFGEGTGINLVITNSLRFINKNFAKISASIQFTLIDIETKIKIFSASAIRLLTAPFDPKTYVTIFNNFTKFLGSQIKRQFEIVKSGGKKLLGLATDAIKKELETEQSLQERIIEIKEQAAARKKEILDKQLEDQEKAREKEKTAEELAAEEQLERDKQRGEQLLKQADAERALEEQKALVRTESAKTIAEALVSAEGDASKRIGKVLKDRAKDELSAIAAAEVQKAIIEAPATFGASLLKIPVILAALTAGQAVVDAIQFHEGGLVGQGSGQETNFNRRLRVNEKRAILETGERVLINETDVELRGLLTNLNATLNKGSSARQTITLKVNDREIARASAKFQPTMQKLNRAGSI